MQSKSMTVFLPCLALDLTYTPASGPKMVKKNNNNSLKNFCRYVLWYFRFCYYLTDD